MLHSRLLTAVAFLLGGTSLFAQQLPTGSLAGTIYDQAGARLEQATVLIRNAQTTTETTTHPDDHGEYRFDNLPAGKYSVRASAKGLTTVQINEIVVQTNKTSTINVTLPESRATPISVVEVSEAPQPVDTPPAPPPPPVTPIPVRVPAVTAAPQAAPLATDNNEDAKILDPKVVVGEINGLRDRLALSADQMAKMHAIFTDRQMQVVAARNDNTITLPARREKIKAIRLEADTKFRALLNENQLDEYDEILRERRERAAQRKQETATASH